MGRRDGRWSQIIGQWLLIGAIALGYGAALTGASRPPEPSHAAAGPDAVHSTHPRDPTDPNDPGNSDPLRDHETGHSVG